MKKRLVMTALALAAVALTPRPAFAVSIGLTDTFTVDEQNWFAGGLGPPPVSFPPVPPDQKPSGGPAGIGDGFLQVTATGGFGAGSRLVAMNGAQWAGNYLGAGVNAIAVDLQNQGASDLIVRLLFENPMGGPPTDIGVTSFGAALPAHSAWMHFVFPVGPLDFVPQGPSNINTLLSNVTLIRIIHSTDPDEADRIIGQLGVDNITATAVPEPATLILTMSGMGAIAMRRRRRA